MLQLIKTFGNISGYKVNNTKSSVLLLSSNERTNPILEVIQFNVVEQFKYLGVQILPRLENILDANYKSLVIEMNESIEKWMSLPVSIRNKLKTQLLNIWYDVQQYLNDSHSLPRYSPIRCNWCFVAGRADATFKLWGTKGLKMIQYLYLIDSDI